MKIIKTLHFWVTLLSLKVLFLCYVVKHIFQDNKESDLKDLNCSVLVRSLVSLLLFRQLLRTIPPVFTYLNQIMYHGYTNQNKNGMCIQEGADLLLPE